MGGQDTATRAAAALSVHHLAKRFGDRVAVDDVSFEIGYGEIFGSSGRTARERPQPSCGTLVWCLVISR